MQLELARRIAQRRANQHQQTMTIFYCSKWEDHYVRPPGANALPSWAFVETVEPRGTGAGVVQGK